MLGGSELCKNYDDSEATSGQFMKSPWGFTANFSIHEQDVVIVRCCQGHFCNHFGMYIDENDPVRMAWPKKFQYKMGVDW